MAPHHVVGKKSLLKGKDGVIRCDYEDELLATYQEPQEKGPTLGQPGLYERLLQEIAQRRRKYRRGKGKANRGLTTESLFPQRKLKEPQTKHKAWLTSSLVVVDEVGYLPIDRREADQFFKCVSYRYEKSSTILTSNNSFSDGQELFGDPVIATALRDRLRHHCKVVPISGHRYRLRQHAFAKQGLVKPADVEV